MHSIKRSSLSSNLNYLGHALCISLLMPTTSAMADATPECNGGTVNSTECGVNSDATATNSTAIGTLSTASGIQSTATGSSSTAAGDGNSTATGSFSIASATNSTATGAFSRAASTGSVSLGRAAGYNGGSSVTDSPETIAIGHYSNIGPTSPGAIAIGGDMDSDSKGAEATAAGAIALGADVVNGVPNSMLINVPFRIEGASPPANALYLTANTIAIGTPTPAKTVHIVKSDGTAAIRVEENSSTVQKRYQIQLENNGPTGFKFTNNNNGNSWQFAQTNAGGFVIANTSSGGQDFVMNNDGRVLMGPGPVTNFNLDPNGDLDIPNGSVTATAHISSSSRTVKKDFAKVDADKVMANIKAMEVTEWRYKDENTKGRHIGPMAEDFYAMFGLGPDDKHVAATDMASIALIAAKELQKENADLTQQLQIKTDDLKTTLSTKTRLLQKENTELKQRLGALEKLVMSLASGQNTLPATGKQFVLNQ